MSKAGLIIVFIGLILRLYKIDLPLLEFYPSRQIQTAEITRNLYREGFNILKPNVRYLGPGPNLFLVEFPLYNSAVAVLYYIFGLHEYLGRIFSVLGWVLSSFFLWKIANKYTGQFAANVALFFYAFSPLSVLISRSFQPDQWMVTLSLGAIYWLLKGLLLPSAIFASVAILLKIPAALFTLIPATFLLLEKGGGKLPNKINYFAITVVPALLWYLYATIVGKSGNALKEAITIANWFGPELFLKSEYYSNIFGFEYNLVLLPVGILLFATGFLMKLKKNQHLLYWWLSSIVLYFIIFNKHNMTHEYYHLPFLPIAAIFIGIGVDRIVKNLDNLIISKRWLLVTGSLMLVAIMLPPTLARAHKPIERFKYVVEVGRIIQAMTKPNDLIIGSMDAGPTLVYYSDRIGWSFETNREESVEQFVFYGVKDKKITDPIDDLEQKRKLGAKIFASTYKPQFLANKQFSSHMYENYKVLEETENYIIFNLRSSSDKPNL